MEWLLFLIAFFTLPDSKDAPSDAEVRDSRNRYIAAGVIFAMGVALRIFYASR